MGVLSTDGQATRPRVGDTGPIVSGPKAGQHTVSATHEWPDTESVDEEIDVNSGDLQGSERKRRHLELTLENAAMELSVVPEALMTVRCATDKTKGKGAPAVSFSGN